VIDDSVGLGRRLVIEARRITKQHEKLGQLWTAVLEPLANGDLEGARRPFMVLAEGLRAHFAIEEEVEIPALHGADAERAAALEQIVADHVEYRAALDRIAERMAADDLEGAGEETAALAAKITDHEAREEALFARPPRR
jgi:iron-sulfur cluster repair protein YtfE (RIC family)